MRKGLNRRDFVRTGVAAGALAGVGDFGFLKALPADAAAQAPNGRPIVPVSADLEPLVRLIEETPRDRLLETAAQRVRNGTSYQELLGALMLAGVRGIRPRPVGFKFHAVLVVNSAHLASLASSDRDRWLPLFWALDNYKQSQARNRQEGDWVMPPLAEAQLPPSHLARQRFVDAMTNWDEEAADRSIAVFSRCASATEVFEPFWRFGARDFRDIGHKAIFVANSWRTLQTIGWRHAEPIVRSLAYALLEHEGSNPAMRDADQDRPGRDNMQRLTRIRAEWARGRSTRDASLELLAAMRSSTAGESCERAVTLLNQEIDPSCIWDAVFLMAGELLMRQPGIVGVHCVTTANALHFGYETTASDETRRFLMLQAVAFMPMFLAAMRGRGQVRDLRVDTMEPLTTANGIPQGVEEIFAEVSRDKLTAARKALGFLQSTNIAGAQALSAAGRRLVFSRGTDSHDYKFSSAILEDFFHATPAWRNRFLAMGMFYLRGAGGPDSALYQRIRAALSAT